jgi:hypothetical protein
MNRLFTTYYAERRPERRRELDLCLALNATAFDRVCVMSEGVAGPTQGNFDWRIVKQRQTYAMMLDWIGQTVTSNDVSIITNCDIVVPAESLRLIETVIGFREMFCLSRYETGAGGVLNLFDAEYSQDVWAFRGLPPAVAAGFFFGVPGCDNRLAAEVQAAGWTVSNPSRDIRTIHVHGSRIRTATNHVNHRLPPPYLFVAPHHLGETPVTRLVTDLAEFANQRRERRATVQAVR